jgi:hypothetical protein
MSGKTYALMFIGIILGGCVGYVISLAYIPEFIDDYFPDNYRARFDGLTKMYQDLSDVQDEAVSEIEGLGEEIEGMQASIAALRGQYDDLDEIHTELEGDNAALPCRRRISPSRMRTRPLRRLSTRPRRVMTLSSCSI